MYNIMLQISDSVGIFGVILILIAYYFLNTGKWVSDSMPYQILNFAGAWLMLFSLFFNWNLASVVIEVAWIAISVMGMVRVVKLRKNLVKVN